MRRCTVVILFVVFCSCSFVAELLNMEAAQIISWSPKRECVAVEEVPYITVCFSNTMNRPLCEEAFSLTKDADKVRGNFAWREQDSVLVFSPAVPVSKGCCYALTVAATAEDIYGNSLAEPFAFDFVTGEELIPPEVLSHAPADGAVGISPRESIRVVFSEPIDEASFYSGFSLFPRSAAGSCGFRKERKCIFYPLRIINSGGAMRCY